MLHRAVTGRKEGEEKSLLRLILRWFYYEEDKGQKIRRLLSCITGVWVVSFFLSFFFFRFAFPLFGRGEMIQAGLRLTSNNNN